jgi:hypothetical protein
MLHFKLNRAHLETFVISYVLLFFELFIIRWLSTTVRYFAYFTNFALLSCFLGMSVGLLVASRKSPEWSDFFRNLLAFIFLATILAPALFAPSSGGEFIWNRDPITMGILPYIVTAALFLFNASLFVHLGKWLGSAMAGGHPLEMYCSNIAGSIAGTLAFLGLSLLYASPPYWFALCFGPAFLLLGKRKEAIFPAIFAASCIILLALPSMLSTGIYWSPYYQITAAPFMVPDSDAKNYQLFVNSDSHQQLLDLGGNSGPSYVQSKRELYGLPYKFNNPKRVLVVGAGGGNDVAAALRSGAKEVDAVEIDPVIASLGKSLHPEKPYDDGRVNLIVDDARSYFRKTNKTYDLVVFGFLDSHRIFSSMPSVRMDSFVYTAESFGEVRRLLNEGGVVAVTFTVHEEWIAGRIFGLLNQTFESEPVVFQSDKDGWGTVFLASKDRQLEVNETIGLVALVQEKKGATPSDYTWLYLDGVSGYVNASAMASQVAVPTDDWPFLYMEHRGIPENYLAMLLIVLLLALLLFWQNNVLAVAKKDAHFFLLGFAFMLIETKSLTEVSLVIGSVWTVTSLVIAGVLLMIFLANLFVIRFKPKKVEPFYMLLFLSIALNYIFPVSNFSGMEYAAKQALSAIYLTLPLFFAGIIFAIFFGKTDDSGRSLGMNTLGAVAGGIAEYAALIFGMKSLYLIGFVAYALSYLLYKRESK